MYYVNITIMKVILNARVNQIGKRQIHNDVDFLGSTSLLLKFLSFI